MKSLSSILRPENLKEFSSVFSQKSYIMAGSTYSFKAIEKKQDIKEIILIDKLPLRYIKKQSNSIVIGALSTFDDMENSILCKKHFFGFISYASSYCSSQLIRNMATAGGNLAHPNAFNIMPLIVETLNGRLKVFYGKEYKILTLEEYYKTKKHGLITEIIIPLKYDKNTFYFEKIAKTKTSWESYITFSFRAQVEKNKIKDLKLVFGAVNAIPVSNVELEKSIVGKDINEINIEQISVKYSEYIYNIHPSHKYSDYRKDVVYNTVKEFLTKLSGR